MRKYLVIFLLPLIVSCSPKGLEEAVIFGRLYSYKDTVAYVSSKGIAETVMLDANKAFTYKISIDKPVLFTLKTGRKTSIEFYLNPGDTTKFTIDFEDIKKGASYQGKLEPINSYMNEKVKVTDKYLPSFDEIYGLEKDIFNLKLDSLKKELLEKVKLLSNREIADAEKSHIDYLIQNLKANYPEYNAYINSIEFNQDSADYSALNSLDMNNAYHLMFSEYSDLVKKVISNKFVKENGSKALEIMPAYERLSKSFALIDANVTSIEMRDFLKQNAFMDDLSYGEFWRLTELVNKYLADCQTVGYKRIIEKLYNQKMLLAPGKPAPAFRYKDVNGKEYALDDFKGKLVYIDFWATWCGPCRHELPFLEEVEKDYQSKKLTFVSVSVDDDMIAWEKLVKDKGMKGLQLHADGAWNSAIVKDYQVKGIPTFFLIDQNGIIITPSAPRPSSGSDLVNLLDKNLAKVI